MKLSPKYQIALGTGTLGIFAGILISSGGFRDSLAKTISIAGGAAIPAIFLTHLIVDTRATRKINDVQDYADDLARDLKQADKQLGDSKARLASLAQEYEGYRQQSEETTQELTSQLNLTKQCLIACEADKNRALDLVTQLQDSIKALEAQVSKDKEQIDYLTSEIQQWELNFHSLVDAESDKKFKAAKASEIQKIFDEHDAITQEAMALFRQLQHWGEKVAHGHNSKREIIRSLATAYNGNLDEINQAIDLERSGYLEQIELLNEKVARLQQEAAGDLVEPTYGDFGFDINGRIANELARTIWQDLQLPLAVKGFQVKTDGAVDIGYGYSRSVSPQAIAETISKHSEALVKKLRLFKITSVRKLEITDCIVVSFRQSPAVKDDEIKLMVGSPDQFISYITSHPIRYRLIADPGVGKTPTTAVMISEILKTGCTRGNTGKGEKVPNTLVTVSYPGAIGSQPPLLNHLKTA
jgi:regulator of replication initiation timing